MNLKVILPFRIFAEKTGVSRIVAETREGSFGLLPHRLDCVTGLAPGILIYETGTEGEVYVAVDEGVLVKTGLDVVVSVRNAIGGTELGQLRAAVEREFLDLSEREQSIRSVMTKMESEFYLFYNCPTSGAVYKPVSQRLLPLDENWRRKLAELPWPTKSLPEVMGGGATTLRALIREYLFVSLFRACAESLASENVSRLAAMQRADKNIDELLEHLNGTFHRIRQSSIDEELFDVISGFEALSVDVK
jgi:alternate F1F0 ATPase F1 subunit epsilon